MRRYRWMWGLAGFAVLAATVGIQLGNDEHIARAATDKVKAITTPRVVMLSGIPGESRTDVVMASPGSATKPTVVASLEHIPEAVVRGVLVPGGGAVVVVADTIPAREPSWAASLLWIEPGQPPRQLVDRVYHASKPLVTQAGRIFVQRGSAGSAPPPSGNVAQLRVDDLSVEEVDPASGTTRTLLTWQGYETHLAGFLDNELIVYRVGPNGADLIALHMDTAQLRVIVPSWPSMARDFSVDEAGRALIVQQLDPGPPRQWVVERVDLATGQRRSVTSSRYLDLVPYAWPDGSILFNPPDRRGPRMLSSAVKVDKLDGPGVLWLRVTSPDRSWIVGSWSVPGVLPVGVIVRTSDGTVVPVPRREDHRVDVLGVVGGAS
jgi:hypothetical protein